jgi:large subunit ribosomal protein L1
MIVDKNAVQKALEACLSESKGKRKFTQSVDLAINFKDLDFTKAENRLNLDVVLPHAPRDLKVAVFADGTLAFEAKKVLDKVIEGAEIAGIAGDKKKQKELLGYSLLAAPQLMAQVGKQLGQLLGARGKLPKPIMPGANLKELVENAKKSVNLKTKGKNLPSVHCIVGKETMNPNELVENILAVLEAVEKVVPEPKIKSVFVKTTMGKAVKVGAQKSG